LQHSDINDAVEALETKLGVGSATPGTATALFPLVAGTAGATSWTQLTAAGITSGTATSGQVLAANGSGAVSFTTPTVPGLVQVVPTSVAVGSGSGSANANGAVTFTGASSVSLNDVFSSTYDNYRIVCDFIGSTTIASYIRLRVAGADNTSTNYNRQYLLANNTSISAGRSTIALWAMTNATSTTRGAYVMDVFNPFLTQVTGAVSQQLGNYNGTSTFALNLEGHGFNTATSFTGFTFFTDTGNATGTISVYGYRD
jgi:hypothetical protein